MLKPHKAAKGSALLTALFIMTLVAIVATAMSTKLQVDIYRTRLIIVHDKLYLASQGVTFWALNELSGDKNRFAKTNKLGMVSQYPSTMENIYPSVKLSGGLYDLQARYNLNNLSNNKLILGFINFLNNSPVKVSNTEKMNLAMAINDWISPYQLFLGKDKYLTYYLSQKPPYYPAHNLMSSSSELRLVKEVDPQSYLALEPFIATLPDITPVNINTASKQVLRSLNNTLKEDQVSELITARGDDGIKRIEKVNELLKKLNIANDQVTVNSQYFLNVAYANSDHFNLTVYTLFKRSRDKKGKLSVDILRQSFNVF